MYLSHVQRARFVNVILPNLRIIEQNIALYYSTQNEMPTSVHLPFIYEGADIYFFTCAVSNQKFILTIDAPNFSYKLNFFDGDELIARPMIESNRVSRSILTRNLAEKMSYVM